MWAWKPVLMPRAESAWAAGGMSQGWVAQMAISADVMEQFRLTGRVLRVCGTTVPEFGAGTTISGGANLWER